LAGGRAIIVDGLEAALPPSKVSRKPGRDEQVPVRVAVQKAAVDGFPPLRVGVINRP